MRDTLPMAAGAARPPWRQTTGRTELRAMVLDFLALNENPAHWTFYRGVAVGNHFHGPDIMLDVGGRIAYVDVQRQGGGGLGRIRKAAQMLARRRGAACFTVRSVPDMEQVLRELGVQLRPKGRMMREQNINMRDGR